jgi:hypothetical protein
MAQGHISLSNSQHVQLLGFLDMLAEQTMLYVGLVRRLEGGE